MFLIFLMITIVDGVSNQWLVIASSYVQYAFIKWIFFSNDNLFSRFMENILIYVKKI